MRVHKSGHTTLKFNETQAVDVDSAKAIISDIEILAGKRIAEAAVKDIIESKNGNSVS